MKENTDNPCMKNLKPFEMLFSSSYYKYFWKASTSMNRSYYCLTRSRWKNFSIACLIRHFFFFYKKSFYKNHQAQNCQKLKNILRIMARLKYMIKNLESTIMILHQEALFTMECLLFTMEFTMKYFCFSLFPFFASCFALRQNVFTIPC